MTFVASRDFLLEIARGKVATHAYEQRVGKNRDVDTGGEEDIWSPGGSMNWQTSAQSVEVVSSDADDVASTGTGCRTMKVWGLGSTFNALNETVNMNGTTAVALSNSYRYIDRAEILTTGSSETNEGIITVRIASAGATLAEIPAGYGQAWHASYVVPAAKSAYIIGWTASLLQATSGSVELRLMVAEDGIGWKTINAQELTQTGSSRASMTEQESMFVLPEKTRLRVRAKASADNMGVASRLSLIVVG